jgi:molybdopterin molybdotransferase
VTENVLSFEAALAVVLEHAAASRPDAALAEHAALDVSLGRTLAVPVLADRDQPPFDRSTRDGFAVHSGAGLSARHIVGSLRAGEVWQGPALRPDEALEIMTGAPLPAGADAVVMVEHVRAGGTTLQLDDARRAPAAGDNIVRRAAESARGDVVLPTGVRIGAAEIALAASCGAASLAVFRRPRVALLATGDELVEVGAQPEAHQIRNSNTHALAALVTGESGIVGSQAIVRDNREDLHALIASARSADLLLLTGGVSMGKYDLVESVLAEDFAAEFFFTGARIQPGKPVVFGRLPAQDKASGWTYFFGLPGNPVSTQVTFALFVAPLLRALSGRAELTPQFAGAELTADIAGNSPVTRFLPARLESSVQHATVTPVAWQGSGDVTANARANCYLVVAAQATPRAGEIVRVLLR